MMKREEIEAIRKRAEAATPGPWYRLFGYGINIVTESDYKVIDEDGGVSKYPDAEFIVKSREDIPKLLAEVERLKELAHEILENCDRAERRVIDEVSTDRNFAIKLQDAVILSYRNEINGVDDDGKVDI